MKGFVFAMNRNRDAYEVPLALCEAGLLSCFVTDFYCWDGAANWLPGAFKKRYRAGLPSSLTRSDLLSFLRQSLGSLTRQPMHEVFKCSDRMLARTTAREACNNLNAVFAYSSYLPDRCDLPPGTLLVDFEYHPHPALCLEIAEEDFAQFPETSFSLEEERRNATIGIERDRWQQADHVICASAMTRRSLIYAGCAAERISLVPYGIDPAVSKVTRREDGECRFLFVGQGMQRKGLHHLIRAWRKARLTDARLTLVCSRIDPGIEVLVREAIAHGFAIDLLGLQSREQLADLYRASDVFVMPSLVEGFGLVYLEALREGCHVIGTENTGLPDLALPAEAVSLVEVGNIDALTDDLLRAARAKRAGLLDPASITESATIRSWSMFRHEVGALAGDLLAGHSAQTVNAASSSGLTELFKLRKR